jgi:hypothetical protein
MLLFRVVFPALLGMVAAAPAAHVDVKVERPAPDEPGKTHEETVSITFRAVDYRPAWDSELRVQPDDDETDTGGTGGDDAAPADTPRPSPRAETSLPRPVPPRVAAPTRTEVRAGRLSLPPPTAGA